MKRTAEFTFLQHEQPDAAAWKQINTFVDDWNKRFDPKFVKTMDFLCIIQFDNQDNPTFKEFSRELAALRSNYSVQYHATSATRMSQDDYRSADFVEILGISLEGIKGKPFILNERDALGSPSACHNCGWQDMFSAPQTAPFAIDESLLDQALADGGRSPQGSWDCINLPNGHKLVSNRVVKLLQDEKVRGWKLMPVLVSSTKKQSTRVFQLLGDNAILVLHQTSPGPQVSVCPVCGAVRSIASDYDTTILQAPLEFCVREDQVGTDEVFSRHPGRGAMLYVSHRVYLLLLNADLNGINPSEVISYCPR
jgi:hypothetical protein